MKSIEVWVQIEFLESKSELRLKLLVANLSGVLSPESLGYESEMSLQSVGASQILNRDLETLGCVAESGLYIEHQVNYKSSLFFI